MENKTPLSLDEMEKVSGGSQKTIHTRNAIVRIGPGSEYNQTGTLSQGTVVNFTGTVDYNNNDGKTWYLINSPMYGWVTKQDLGV